MIRINLALKKQASFAAAEGGKKSLTSMFSSARLDTDLLKELPIAKLLILVAAFVGGNMTLNSYKEKIIFELDQKINAAEQTNRMLQQKVNAGKSDQELEKQLKEDENSMKSKIETIEALVQDRTKSTSMLLLLSEIMPEGVWITDFSIDGPAVKIAGGSSDFNQVSDFMKRLGESIYFQDVSPEDVQSEQTGGEQASFRLSAKRR